MVMISLCYSIKINKKSAPICLISVISVLFTESLLFQRLQQKLQAIQFDLVKGI